MPKPTARERIERAFHVSFKTPEQAAELLDAYRDQILTEAAELIQSHRSAFHATQTGLDRARKLILDARTVLEG